MTTTSDRPVLVAGAWDAGAHDTWIPVLDPADLRRVVARVPALDAADIARTYDAAEAGARSWRAAGPLERGAVLLRAAGLLRERAADIARDLVLEMGKTLAEATGEVGKAADFFEYYGSMA
ncbi:aldehyde dehydrogenase family protein, partial [Frankia sp. AvcI1]